MGSGKWIELRLSFAFGPTFSIAVCLAEKLESTRRISSQQLALVRHLTCYAGKSQGPFRSNRHFLILLLV